MKYLIIQLLAVAFCWFAARSMRKHAIAYYVGAFALEALFLYGKFFSLPSFLWTPIFFAVDQCMLGTALFVVVMFVGVFPKNSPIAQRLRPSRGELSIFAWILCMGESLDGALDTAIRQDIRLTVGACDAAQRVSQAAQQTNTPAKVHFKVDTGLHRIGFAPDTAAEQIVRCTALP